MTNLLDTLTSACSLASRQSQAASSLQRVVPAIKAKNLNTIPSDQHKQKTRMTDESIDEYPLCLLKVKLNRLNPIQGIHKHLLLLQRHTIRFVAKFLEYFF